MQSAQFCDAFYQQSDFRAEGVGNIFRSDRAGLRLALVLDHPIFEHVVQQAGDNGCLIHLQLGENVSHFNRVNDVGLP
ncbi:MAG: hypothetical protein BWY76_03127 [bacterium ADurb.Bin429]|nr:MAG: hypothetical protein BWY76_03127 [bacterium ADurb.Bin429]